jgi:hypothetical protein
VAGAQSAFAQLLSLTTTDSVLLMLDREVMALLTVDASDSVLLLLDDGSSGVTVGSLALLLLVLLSLTDVDSVLLLQDATGAGAVGAVQACLQAPLKDSPSRPETRWSLLATQ